MTDVAVRTDEPVRVAGRGRDRRPAPTEAPRQPGPSTYDCPARPCPCLVGHCTLSRMDRALSARDGALGLPDCPYLTDGEQRLAQRLADYDLDAISIGAVTNIQRGVSALRGYFERVVLASHNLTWTAWATLWQVWIWDEIEARHVAEEVNISKGTLTGVAHTLESRGWLQRRTHPDDARRTLFSLTEAGQELMETLCPQFAAQEQAALAPLTRAETAQLSTMMRRIIMHVEGTAGL